MATVGVSLPVPPGTGVGAAAGTSGMSGAKTLLVSGSFGGTVIVEAAAVGGGPFCQIASFQGPGTKVVKVACSEMRARSQGVTGAPIVDVSAEQGVVEAVDLAVPAGNGVGAASDISALGELTTAIVSPFGTGTVAIELSEDGVNWVQGFSTFVPGGGCVTQVTPANFARVRRAGVTGGAAPVCQLAAIADVGGGASVAAPRTCFVFRPGDPLGARENVYIDWPSLMAAVGTVQGQRTICMDDSFVSPLVIPPGVWDLTSVEMAGMRSIVADGVLVSLVSPTPIDISDGVVFTSSLPFPAFPGVTIQLYRFRGVRLRKVGGAAVTPITLGGATVLSGVELIDSHLGDTVGGSAGALIDVGPAFGAVLSLLRSAIDDAATIIVTVSGAAGLLLELLEGALVDAFDIGGTIADSMILRFIDDSAQIINSFTGFLGVITASNRAFDRWTIEALPGPPGVAVIGSLHRIDTSAGDITVPLPASSITTVGNKTALKKVSGDGNDAIFAPVGTDTIVGADRTSTAFGYIEMIDNGDGTWSTGAVV